MKYTIDQEKANNPEHTTIVIHCTKGEKYRFLQAAKQKNMKLKDWAIEAMNNKEKNDSVLFLD